MTKNSKSHVKIGDTIKIIAGNQKGLIGNIKSILRKKSLVVVEGVLPRVKSVKSKEGEEPKQIELPVPIHISNVMLWDSTAKVASRVGYKVTENKKVRYFKKSGTNVSSN